MIKVNDHRQTTRGVIGHASSYYNQDKHKQYSRYHSNLHVTKVQHGQHAKQYPLSLLCSNSTYTFVVLTAPEAEHGYGYLLMHVSEHGVYARGHVLLPCLALFGNKHACGQSHVLSSLLYIVFDMQFYDLCFLDNAVSSLQAYALYFLGSTLRGNHASALYELQHTRCDKHGPALDEPLYRLYFSCLLALYELDSAAFCTLLCMLYTKIASRLYGLYTWRRTQGWQEGFVCKGLRTVCGACRFEVNYPYGRKILSFVTASAIDSSAGPKTYVDLPQHFITNRPVEQVYRPFWHVEIHAGVVL